MIIKENINIPKISYTNETTDAYSNQVNCTACIYIDGVIVGCADYVLYDGELTISLIEIKSEYRRAGYGSRLIKYIKQENPEYTYVSSMQTEDGAAFVHKNINLYETLEFKQGGDPYNTLGVGLWKKPFKDGDKIQVLSDLYYNKEHTTDITNDKRFSKGEIIHFETYHFRDGDDRGIFTSQTRRGNFIFLQWVLDHTHLFKRILNESLSFKQGGDPYKKLDIGNDRVGGSVTTKNIEDMLIDISKDYQFDKNDPDYMGFLNMNINDLPPRTQDYMREYLMRWNEPHFEQFVDNLGIFLQSADPDGAEIIFYNFG